MSNNLPTYDQIVGLHMKYAPSQEAFNLVFTHCYIIWEISEQLIEKSKFSVDADLVRVGCLLHDIGVYHLYLPNGQIDHANYIMHGTLGHTILRDEGYNEEICRFASCHTGVGLSKKEIEEEGLPMPPADYFAETLEERLVMYADKFHTKTTPPKFMMPETYAGHIRKFGGAKVKYFQHLQEEFGVPSVYLLAEKYELEVV